MILVNNTGADIRDFEQSIRQSIQENKPLDEDRVDFADRICIAITNLNDNLQP